ncbi:MULTISPECIES: glycosyltransferase family 87 protein [unclassified Streptomyces]|uniref:glycosyltransferase family 87 protein n=1 Tax=unclassified Streptomyces TaxID=2593676 RepID=UPI00109E5D06|nr:glycosyltransferase family 87 protein [Streptomyces sp. A1136]THA55976.1 DUF2029 domain-containing protein [Streptomyces sp. A1136]
MTATSSPPSAPTPSATAPAARGRGAFATAVRGRGALPATAALWAASRALMLWMLVHDFHSSNLVRVDVSGTYHNWYDILVTWSMPHDDITWQYPPAAAAIFLSPDLLPFLTYFQAFVALTVLCDAVILVGLLRAARRRDGSRAGALFWLLTLPLLMATPFARYDVQVTLLAVGSLLCLRHRPRLAGVIAGIGAMVKVWPLLALFGAPRGKSTREAVIAAALSCVALLALFAALFRDSLGFLGNQGDRGVQVESVGGSALMLAMRTGIWPGRITFQYGAFEYVGPYVPAIARASITLTVIGFVLLVLWRVRARRWTTATPADAALCAIMVFTVTSRVISPQYMIWLLGLAAVCLTSRHTTQRPIAWLLAAATLLTSLVFPVWYGDVLQNTWFGTILLCARNGVLLYATVWSGVRLWRATVTRSAADAESAAAATAEGTRAARA